jgi:hypothetical protein
LQTVSRDELYEQVWSKPMTKIAAEYGVTGTALKKTCNRHGIPTPERGYWAKLAHGKPVHKAPLPKPVEGRPNQIQIAGSGAYQLPEAVREAKAKAHEQLEALVATETQVAESRVLAATRRAILRARPDQQGFAAARGYGVVPLKISPASIERGLRVLSQLLSLAEAQGYRPRATDNGLVLVVDGVSIAFGLEEQPQKTPHEPTAAELKQRDRNLQWRSSSTPWPKYDHAPSGRLAIVIQTNPYSGLRRTYSDRKTRTIESTLPAVLVGFVEHASVSRERQHAEEERARQREEAEARRRREEAFEAREKRRMEFVDAIHEQLLCRTKLSAVLRHLERVGAEEASKVKTMAEWIKGRLRPIDALVSPSFLELSARWAKVDFAERSPEKETEGAGGYLGYSRSVELRFWSIDEEEELATSKSAREWLVEAGLVPEL